MSEEKSIHVENNQLWRENEKLRAEIAKRDGEPLPAMLGTLTLENAKLRELLRECLKEFHAFDISLRPFRSYEDVPKEIGGQIYCSSSDMYEKIKAALGEGDG